MKISHLALLFVVLLDIMSQGLVIPIVTTILLNPDQGFLPHRTTMAARQFDFGLVMGIFFLSWFLGAAYISKLSDSIGRKAGILICLTGNLIGYILTILSLELNSLALLIAARTISGFTAGNQPIAQAALVDLSENDVQKTQFMGYVITAGSAGFVVGPLMGGLLSDKRLLGSVASAELPFFAASAMVIINIVLIVFFFHERNFRRRPMHIRPVEVFLTLWQAVQRPVILRLSLVFFFGMLAFNAFYVFMTNVFFSRFQFDTLDNAIALIILGVFVGLAGAFLVAPINKRYNRTPIVVVSLFAMGGGVAASIVNPWPLAAYVFIVPFFVGFGVYYPTIVTMFSKAVSDQEQGWVMGVMVALYTLGAGLISVIGGRLTAVDIRLPFLVALAAALLAVILIVLLWRGEDIRKLSRK